MLMLWGVVVETLAYWAVYVIVQILRRLPIEWCFRLGRAVGLLLWAVLPGYRRLAESNIADAMGTTPREARRLAREHFATLGANAASSFRVAAMSPDEISRIARIEHLDRLREPISQGRGVVLAINHIGNWELYAQLVYRVPEARFGTVYQALRNARLDALINADRRRLGVQTFDRKKGFAGALAMLREPGIVGVLVDQNAGDGGMWTPFFNRLSSTSTLAAGLAMRTGSAVVPVAIFTEGLARWRVVLEPEIPWQGNRPEQLTADINTALERQIRQAPADWFWVHNRWKTPWPNFLTVNQKRGVHLPPGISGEQLRPFRIVLRSPNWLGDACMAVDAARAFKHGRPDARLAVLCPEKLGPLWGEVPEVDEVLTFRPGDSPLAIARKLRGRFEAAVVLPNSLRSALEVWLAGIPRRVGRPGRHRSRLLNQIVREKQKAPRPRHQADLYMDIALRCGGRIPPPRDVSWNAPQGEHILLVCPGAEYGPAKRWPAGRFRETMEMLSSRVTCRWVVVGSAGDMETAAQLCEGFTGQVENRAGKTTLGELMDQLRTCSALLTNDTGTMHLADALGVPLVAVFGSTEPRLTGPRHPRAIVLRRHVECSPCFLRICPLDFRCMKAVSPADAAAALLGLLARPPTSIVPPPADQSGNNQP